MTIELDPELDSYYDASEDSNVPAEEGTGTGNAEEAGGISLFSAGSEFVLPQPLNTPLPLPNIPRPQTASELMAQYPNLSLASIGLMLMVDIAYEKMAAEYETVELLRQTSKKMRQNIINGNNAFLKAIQKIGQDNSNKNAGIGPSGKIVGVNASLWDKIWKWLVAIAVLVVVALAQFFLPGIGQVLLVCLMAVIMFGSNVINLLINAGVISENSRIANDLSEIFSLLNPIYLILDIASTLIIYGLEKSGKISKKQADQARMIAAIVVQVLAAIIMIIGALALMYFTAGAATPVSAASIAMAVASVVSAVMSLVNSGFAIARAVRQLELVDEVFECDKLRAVVESIKMMLQNLTNTIDFMIQALKSDLDVVTMEFSNMAEIIKREGDIKASIARNITI
jgi:hypothetical protein